MRTTSPAASTAEGNFIGFEIRDGIRRVSCTVLNEALDAASGLPGSSTPMSRQRSFHRFRTLIHAAAILRLKALPQGTLEPIVLTGRDLRSVPPEAGTPLFGSSARQPVRPVPLGAATSKESQ